MHVKLFFTREILVAVINAFGEVGTIASSGTQIVFCLVMLEHHMSTRSFKVALYAEELAHMVRNVTMGD